MKSEIKNIGGLAATSREELVSADRTIKKSLATQQQVVSQMTSSKANSAGWLFLGKVSQDKATWIAGSPQTINSIPLPINPGAKLTIRDDSYLRADGASNSRASSSIISVIKVGEVVDVDDVDFSHAKGGGWFTWAKVHREN